MDWADEKAREWYLTIWARAPEDAIQNDCPSLAALLREAGQEERERTNREDWPLAKKAIASIEHDRVLAEVSRLRELLDEAWKALDSRLARVGLESEIRAALRGGEK